MRFALLPAEIEVPALRPEFADQSPAAARFDLSSVWSWWRKTSWHRNNGASDEVGEFDARAFWWVCSPLLETRGPRPVSEPGGGSGENG